jgi:uncharacterized protein
MMIDLKKQLSLLIQLQALDTQIYGLNAEKSVKPHEIETLKTAFEVEKANLANLEKVQLDFQKQKADKELELASKEESARKLQTQLYQLKTNKEYNTMLQQIQDAKADASTVEDRILEAMDKLEKAKKDIDEERKTLQQKEQVFTEEKKKIEIRIKEIDDRLAQLDSQRKQLIPDIDKKMLSQYERILRSRDGLAIVTVKNNTCSGCNMFVPAQVINLIQMYERIITCEVCNRILYIDDDQS